VITLTSLAIAERPRCRVR